jgi:hypothetical protein
MLHQCLFVRDTAVRRQGVEPFLRDRPHGPFIPSCARADARRVSLATRGTLKGPPQGITLCVYPTADIELDPSLPTNAEFWVPEPDEIDDNEGFGMFQDVWPITDVSVDEANAVAREDGLLCQVVAGLARDAVDFDILAAAVETGSVGEEDEISAESLAALAPYLTGKAALESLEAGVAGLVYALSAAGMFPAASCRGHAESDAWSAIPVVMFAADRIHAEPLQPLVVGSGCGFGLDPVRPELLVINGRSVEDTLRLGRVVLASIGVFQSLG